VFRGVLNFSMNLEPFVTILSVCRCEGFCIARRRVSGDGLVWAWRRLNSNTSVLVAMDAFAGAGLSVLRGDLPFSAESFVRSAATGRGRSRS